MPTVNSTIFIQAPLEKVYAISKDNSRFPEFMKDVQSLIVVESDGQRIVSDYVGIVSAFGLKVKWHQEDVWDDAQHLCTFKQLSGDYDKLEGTWKFTEENGGTRFDSFLDYEYKIPGLGVLVGQVIHGLVVKNIEGVLQAIKERSES